MYHLIDTEIDRKSGHKIEKNFVFHYQTFNINRTATRLVSRRLLLDSVKRSNIILI